MSTIIQSRGGAVAALFALVLGVSCASRPAPSPANGPSVACAAIAEMTLYDANEVGFGDRAGFEGRHPAAFAPWAIAQGEAPEGLALIDTAALLAQGETDKQGRIRIDPGAMERINEAHCVRGKPIWLVFPGRTVRLGGKS